MSEARIIDGRAYAEGLRARIAEQVAQLKADHGVQPGLAVVLVGEDPASQIYVRSKGEQTEAVGMRSISLHLPANIPEADLLDVVAKLNADPQVHGILVQFPVPPPLQQAPIVAAIDPGKDVDGLTVLNAGRLASGLPGLAPCTPSGCMMLIRDVMPELRGKRAVVIGRSNLMGKPMAQLLLAADCTVTIAHSRTADLAGVCREADVLVAAVGRAEMVRADWIKPGAVVIDVGVSRLPARDPVKAAEGKTRIVGDVAFEEARTVASWLTPPVGGVGPMTIACLLQNTLTAARRLNGLEA